MNKVLLIGRVGAVPVTRRSPAGRNVASFSLETRHSWLSAEGEQHEEIERFNIVAWDRLAELCAARLVAGGQAYVEGRLRTHHWEDEQGNAHVRTEVIAQEIVALPAE